MDASLRTDDSRAPLAVPALRYRPQVDGLRAIAVILVILFHARLPLAPGGFVGVDVFFVISGFLITGLLAQELRATGTVRLVGFWARRARRILPAAILVLFASLALAAPKLRHIVTDYGPSPTATRRQKAHRALRVLLRGRLP